jgi:signal transduction histidine kinase
MIKALRRKFILVNMLLVFLVLAVVVFVFCVSSYRRAADENRAALRRGLNLRRSLNRGDRQRPPPYRVGQGPPADFARPPLFVIRIDRNGPARLLFSENVDVAAGELAQIAKELAARPERAGILKNYNLRFMKEFERGGIEAALIDRSREQSDLRNAFFISSFSLLGSLLVFFVISFFLSKWVFKPAELAWKQQRRFVADASHELKTPLTVILANTNILKNNSADTIKKQWKWVENTEAEAKRMKKLIDSLLFLAKSDDARIKTVHTKVNFSDVVLSCSLAFEPVAYERQISINTGGLQPGICVAGDELQLRQLAAILLDNAVKYSLEGDPVSVSLAARQTQALLSVRNGGAPLSPEDMEHLFERFYRADKARASEGYGLGLAIAKSITELHRGKISVESHDGIGAVVTVSLPVYADRR